MTFVADAASDPDLPTLVSVLTNGANDIIGFALFGPEGFGQTSLPEESSLFEELSLRLESDLVGYDVARITLTVHDLRFSPFMAPEAGGWNDSRAVDVRLRSPGTEARGLYTDGLFGGIAAGLAALLRRQMRMSDGDSERGQFESNPARDALLSPGAGFVFSNGARERLGTAATHRSATGQVAPSARRDKLVGDARNPPSSFRRPSRWSYSSCASITANLLLVCGSARQREIAIPTAIGAGRARVLRQFFVESLLLGAIGCASGLLAARGLVAIMLRVLPLAVPRLPETTIDARVLAFALGACLATTFVFALVPAIAMSKTNVYETLKDGAWSAASSVRSVHARSAFVWRLG